MRSLLGEPILIWLLLTECSDWKVGWITLRYFCLVGDSCVLRGDGVHSVCSQGKCNIYARGDT